MCVRKALENYPHLLLGEFCGKAEAGESYIYTKSSQMFWFYGRFVGQ
jgi:hypothetical protein